MQLRHGCLPGHRDLSFKARRLRELLLRKFSGLNSFYFRKKPAISFHSLPEEHLRRLPLHGQPLRLEFEIDSPQG